MVDACLAHTWGMPCQRIPQVFVKFMLPVSGTPMASVHRLLPRCSLTKESFCSAWPSCNFFLWSPCLTVLKRGRIDLKPCKTPSTFPVLHVSLHFCHWRKTCVLLGLWLAKLLHGVMAVTSWRRSKQSSMMGWWLKQGTCKSSGRYVNQISNLLRRGNLSYF